MGVASGQKEHGACNLWSCDNGRKIGATCAKVRARKTSKSLVKVLQSVLCEVLDCVDGEAALRYKPRSFLPL